jgi:putative ABC transport system permease protein
MSGEPGGFFDRYPIEVEGNDEKWTARTEFADHRFVNTLGLKIIAGRDFSPEFGTDSSSAVIISRTAAASLNFTPEEAIGKWIRNAMRDNSRRRIVGVIEDFNFLSLKDNIEPLVISPADDRRVALVRLRTGYLEEGLEAIKTVYTSVAPAYPFEYSFLDENFDILYKNDIRQQRILAIFAGLAIFVACLGLFGLASFTATKRSKEISIRKVLGSSVKNIVMILSRDLLKPVLIATFIAIPVGYWLMKNWLENFAYRISLSWWIFIVAIIVTLSIAMVTVSLKAIKAAKAKPVKNLRTE